MKIQVHGCSTNRNGICGTNHAIPQSFVVTGYVSIQIHVAIYFWLTLLISRLWKDHTRVECN